MKCIKDKKGKITRVSDDIAWTKVARENYTYCSKDEWKEATRPKSAGPKPVKE